MKEQKFNMNFHDAPAFFAHEMTAHFTPTQFTLDFKCITPRTDPRSTTTTFLMQHNVVMLEPWHVKNLMVVLNNMVQKYEGSYGKITKPKAVAKAEKQRKKTTKKKSPEKTVGVSYFG